MPLVTLLAAQQGEKAPRHCRPEQHMELHSHPEATAPATMQEIPTLASFQITWGENISSSYTLPNVFYYLVTQWLSLSISSPPLKNYFSFFLPRNKDFFVYLIFVYHIVPCKGKIEAVGNLLHTLAWTCKQDKHCLFTTAFLDMAFSTCLQLGCELGLDMAVSNLLEPHSQK